MKQGCTQVYKINPINRKVRQLLQEKHGISIKSKRIPAGCVNTWIGFSWDEALRVKEAKRKYIKFSYPLIDMRLTKGDVLQYYLDNDYPIPPRSVCNGCFANNVQYFKNLHDNQPDDWAQAVAVDNAVRDLTQIGVKNPAFVSATLVPLEELAARDFKLDENQEEMQCHSGYCFT